MTTNSAEDYLRGFLNIYWLRPENAMWRAINCMAMEDIKFETPSLDSSCGDGVFSFLQAGGRFNVDFDVYSSVGELNNFTKGADVYDAYTETYKPVIDKHADRKITWGLDWKDNLLAKANALGFYENVKVHDNNQALPFENDMFKSIFSNSAYWIENLEFHMLELARVLHPEGQAVLVLMTNMTQEYTLSAMEPYFGSRWIDLIDRGRKENYKGLRGYDEWDQILSDAGFTIVDKRPQITWVHSFVEYIGLRPISPVMIKMANALDLEKRREIKEEWIDTWTELLLPLVKPGFDIGQNKPPVEYIYVLKKTS